MIKCFENWPRAQTLKLVLQFLLKHQYIRSQYTPGETYRCTQGSGMGTRFGGYVADLALLSKVEWWSTSPGVKKKKWNHSLLAIPGRSPVPHKGARGKICHIFQRISQNKKSGVFQNPGGRNWIRSGIFGYESHHQWASPQHHPEIKGPNHGNPTGSRFKPPRERTSLLAKFNDGSTSPNRGWKPPNPTSAGRTP